MVDKKYNQFIKSDNEVEKAFKEYFITKLIENKDKYIKRGFIRFDITMENYPNIDIPYSWLNKVCRYYLGASKLECKFNILTDAYDIRIINR